MAEASHKKELEYSQLMGSEDGDPQHSIPFGSQEVYDYYCQPCDVDDKQIEATSYCNNCTEYLCQKCSTSHKKFKLSKDHDILEVQLMTNKPPISKKIPTTSSDKPDHATSKRPVTMATHVKNIESSGSIASSVLLSSNKLLVADYQNSKVRLLDTGCGTMVSELNLPGNPWQVTRIRDTEAAVTLPREKKILLLRTQPQLSVIRLISIQEECFGIAYMDNRLIVSFIEGHNLAIMDMSGTVLRTISDNQKGFFTKKSFSKPNGLAVDTASSSIYVINEKNLVKLSMEGSILAKYRSDRGGLPNEVTFGSQGMLYQVWIDKLGQSGRVEQLSANCVKVRTIIPDLSPPPLALSYDEATQQLYVGQEHGEVKVYRLC